MKTILMMCIALFATFTTFSQKSKANSTNTQPSTIQVQYTCPMHPEVVSNKPGDCPKCNMDLSLSKKEQMKREVTKTYTCLMHPEVSSVKTYTCLMHPEVSSVNPGNCPKCSSKLVVDRRGSKQGTTVYTCSMHPEVGSTTGGKCPICGMDMQAKTAQNKSSKSKM